jgi:hypothetical protein
MRRSFQVALFATSLLVSFCLPVAASEVPDASGPGGSRGQSLYLDIASPEAALIAVENPPAGTVGRLLAEGVMVVREMQGYLLVAAEPSQMSLLTSMGLDWTILDQPVDGKTYYTVGAGAGAVAADIEAGGRVLRFARGEAVVEASPEGAGRIASAGFDIARVFLRPIREPARTLIEVAAPMAPAQADPVIQDMVDAVSSSTVDTHVQRLQDFRTRHSTTDSCQAAANWIKAKFESYGIDSVYFHDYSTSYKANVVAVIPGAANPDKIVVIGGHYDSYTSSINNCPGADDNASGIACLLEVARILSQYQFNYTLTFIAFSGEEQGLFGSEAYAAEAAARGDDIIGMIGVDMIGYLASGDGLDLDIIDNVSSEWLSALAYEVQGLYVPELSTVEGYIPGGASSDHASFWAAGYDAILFFEDSGSYSPYIHTTNDLVGLSYNSSTLAEGSVKIAVALTATMAEPFRVGISHTPLADTEDTENPYRVVADIVAAGTLNPDSLLVCYSVGSSWNRLTMSTTGTADEYEAFIPAQPGGTWVDYYIVAEDTDGNRATDPSGAPAAVHTFFVGEIATVFADDFETAKGWTVGATGDGATTGIWERCDPAATVAQAEDDHTVAPGVNAYITQCASGSGQGSYDVDGGKTTLLSPVFDLSEYGSAEVSYWRWYSNDTGSNPEADDWYVDVSDDSGATWVRLETLQTSQRVWTLIERDLADYVDLTSKVRFRFVAADTGSGSIVEAGVDDFAIVTYQDAATGVARPDPEAAGITLARNVPNPFGAETAISLVVPSPGAKVSLRIVDVRGRQVASLLRAERVVGPRTVTWDGANDLGAKVAAGIYFCELVAGDQRLLGKITLVR